MSARIFDGFLLMLFSFVLIQAFRTPGEAYDVMGPALWPGIVAAVGIVLLGLLLVFNRSDDDEKAPIRPRFWLFCATAVLLVAIQSLAIAPFFLIATAFCICSYLLVAYDLSPMRLTFSAVSALVFCYAIQWLFTNLVHLDISISF